MVVTEMGLLSGHQAIAPKNLIGQVKNLKRVETTEQKVVLYFDEIAENEEAICFMVASKPVKKIINPQPVQIYSFPYYFPDKRVVGSYSMPQAMASSICDECAECCEDDYIAGADPVIRTTGSTAYPPFAGASGVSSNTITLVITFTIATLLSFLLAM
ncbi:hypothetical protein CAPTEDRAFT_200400 [Capitella teleta]|uniref:Alpha-macroglobulin receptor-binding domain-containing protein n=1 Tax=Capitella teleta TaxID=283909 RepID=R7V206_CAPTE|nr:hypothetical protein CAPTEDRAFT_200400 [Capitella teleta]|eukprot:ELU10361.1 hypothetical protein CAPTEDRAFT_200400 [Capitella teleta]